MGFPEFLEAKRGAMEESEVDDRLLGGKGVFAARAASLAKIVTSLDDSSGVLADGAALHGPVLPKRPSPRAVGVKSITSRISDSLMVAREVIRSCAMRSP